MSFTLHLGVADVPYSHNEPASGRSKNKPPPAITTGDVAEILEDKYHVMRIFFELHAKDIAKDIECGLAGALEDVLGGAPVGGNPFAAGESGIEKRFHTFLEQKEMDALGYPGVPTRASLEGVSHRFKRRHGPPRPSFIDTGLYESSFKAWVD